MNYSDLKKKLHFILKQQLNALHYHSFKKLNGLVDRPTSYDENKEIDVNIWHYLILKIQKYNIHFAMKYSIFNEDIQAYLMLAITDNIVKLSFDDSHCEPLFFKVNPQKKAIISYQFDFEHTHSVLANFDDNKSLFFENNYVQAFKNQLFKSKKVIFHITITDTNQTKETHARFIVKVDNFDKARQYLFEDKLF